jgi:hypothetical protein
MRKNKCFSLSRSAAAPGRRRTGLDRAMPQRQRARLVVIRHGATLVRQSVTECS